MHSPAAEPDPATDPHSAATALFLHHPVPLWVYERTSLAFLAINDAAIAHYGYSREEFLSMRLVDLLADVTDAEMQALRDNQGRRKAWRQNGFRCYRKADGSIIQAEITAHDLIFEGRPAVAVAAYDVTRRLEAEHAAREAERRLNEAQQLAQIGSWRWDVTTDTVIWSDQLFAIAGIPPGGGAPCFAEQRSLYLPADWIRLVAAVQGTLKTGDPYEVEVELLRHDRTIRTIISRGAVVRDAGGRVVALHGTVHDITERRMKDALLRAAGERLQESETRYRELVENLDDVVFSVDAAGIVLYASPAVEQFGYAPDELIGRPLATIVHHEDHELVHASFGEAFGGSRLKREFRVIDRAGRTRHVRCSNRAQCRDGRAVSITGVLIDITEQRVAQEQLRAAGRLEAVGRLAGGVAHDFNNLLVAINGFAELALSGVSPDDPIGADLQEILKAGNRAAALTSQLLAFSRRQVLHPDAVSLNDVIASMEPMLRRLIGEDIELAVTCDPEVREVSVDASHLEHVIMNLVVNARDAMPNGGLLRIGTSRSDFPFDELPEPLTGENIAVITVTDTGEGMDETTQAQIFEPFFTTKPPGQGTGLGLAMAYGFVKQSGGAISVRSAPGAGATFRIALPRNQSQSRRADHRVPAVASGSETILITEDEETVRTLVRRVLRSAGYRVLAAGGADAALDICRSYEGRIHLLLTDVVMPRTSGPVLAERARQLRPDMAVLFMSGYSGNEVYARGLVDGSMPYLQKPFSASSLSEAVRVALTTS